MRQLPWHMGRLFSELALARANGTYSRVLARIAKAQVLVLDDWAKAPITEVERRDLLEVLEDRYSARSTIVTSQVSHQRGHEYIAEPTHADAICDRLIHNAPKLVLKGPSKRKNEEAETDKYLPITHPIDPAIATVRFGDHDALVSVIAFSELRKVYPGGLFGANRTQGGSSSYSHSSPGSVFAHELHHAYRYASGLWENFNLREEEIEATKFENAFRWESCERSRDAHESSPKVVPSY